MSKVLRTAVIGLGRIGWDYHIPEILNHEGFELCSAVDTGVERISEFEEKYNKRGYTDLGEMLKAEKPDLAVVATPTHLHMQHAITCFENGVDVFLDKPAAKNVDEVRKIRDAAEKYGRKVMTFQPHRANPIVNTLKEVIKEGKIGEVYAIKRAASDYCRRNDWQALKKFAGGMINNYGAHYIDQLGYLVGEKLEIKYCHARCVATLGDADDVCKVIMKTASGIDLDLDINQATAHKITDWMIFGKYGTITCPYTFALPGAYYEIKYLIPSELPEISLDDGLSAKGRAYCGEQFNWHEEKVDISPDKAIDFYVKCYEFFALDKAPFVPIDETVMLMEHINTCHELSGM